MRAAVTEGQISTEPVLASSSYHNFPQAQSMADFPTAGHDMLHWDELLTDKEKATKYKVRQFVVSSNTCALLNCLALHYLPIFSSNTPVERSQQGQCLHVPRPAQLTLTLAPSCPLSSFAAHFTFHANSFIS